MKIQNRSAAPLLFEGASRPASGGAFEQTIRALERDMWAGAAAGESRAHTIEFEPATHAPKAVPRNSFEEVSAHRTDQRSVTGAAPYLSARDSTQFIGARSDMDRTTVEHPFIERLFQADVSAPTAALSPARSETRSCGKECAVQPPLLKDSPSDAPLSSARERREQTSSPAESRTTAHFGDEGMQLVMRIQGASRDEALSISRQTADVLRRRMTGPVRVVVNGVQNEEVNSRKMSYPAFHGETYGN